VNKDIHKNQTDGLQSTLELFISNSHYSHHSHVHNYCVTKVCVRALDKWPRRTKQRNGLPPPSCFSDAYGNQQCSCASLSEMQSVACHRWKEVFLLWRDDAGRAETIVTAARKSVSAQCDSARCVSAQYWERS